jgi:hypothetical protein
MLLEVTTWSWDLSVLASIRFSRTPVCLEGGGGGGGGRPESRELYTGLRISEMAFPAF